MKTADFKTNNTKRGDNCIAGASSLLRCITLIREKLRVRRVATISSGLTHIAFCPIHGSGERQALETMWYRPSCRRMWTKEVAGWRHTLFIGDAVWGSRRLAVCRALGIERFWILHHGGHWAVRCIGDSRWLSSIMSRDKGINSPKMALMALVIVRCIPNTIAISWRHR